MAAITKLQFHGPYREMYTTLFNAVTDSINMMELRDVDAAKQKLKTAQREVEEIFLAWEERERRS